MEGAEARLQLAVCYKTGFGVEPDAFEMLRYLRIALPFNHIARSLYRRVEKAYASEKDMSFDLATQADLQLEHMMTDALYFVHRIQTYQRSLIDHTIQRVWRCDNVEFQLSNADTLRNIFQVNNHSQACISADTAGVLARRSNPLDLVAEIGDAVLVGQLLKSRNWSDEELASAMIKACEYGHFALAMLLSSHCKQVLDEESVPSPLHWLFMFNDDEAKQLATALIFGSSKDHENANGICKNVINVMSRPDIQSNFLPEHCLQLTGSPLHWAVWTRNLHVVSILIEFGADPHLSRPGNSLPVNYPEHHLFSCTPFELAVALHLPEICDTMWNGTSRSRQVTLASSAIFHCIGLPTLPFQRDMIHGADYARALSDTMSYLQSWGFDICCRNEAGETTFMAALADPDEEIYILREILHAGDFSDEISKNGRTAATLAAATSSVRRHNVERMLLAVESTKDINAMDHSGFNALHYLTILDNGLLCQNLLQAEGFNINERRPNGETAVHLAATHNAGTVLKILIHERADIENQDCDLRTPLAVAILLRQKEAFDTLMKAGADIHLGNCVGSPHTGVLHLAVSGPHSGASVASHLLETYPIFQHPFQLNLVDRFGWTPLHPAACFADYQGAAALLEDGAASEAVCSRRLPIVKGRTALNVAFSLLQRIKDTADLGRDHERIRKKGRTAITAFQLQLEEVIVILEQSRRTQDLTKEVPEY